VLLEPRVRQRLQVSRIWFIGGVVLREGVISEGDGEHLPKEPD
jgi:hypothetical protein